MLSQRQNVILRAATMTDAAVIDVADLELAGATSASQTPAAAPAGALDEAVATCQKALLQQRWPQCPSTCKWAERLGASHSVIAQRLRRYGIAVSRGALRRPRRMPPAASA